MQKGDLVWSRDAATGTTQLKPIEQTFEKHSATLALTFDNGETIETTSEHPFYVVGRGFVAAGELGIGTSIVTRAGPTVQLVSSVAGKAQTVYNFEVADFHTYFVGEGEVWVHNTCDGLKSPLDKTPYPKDPTSKPLAPGLEPGEYVYVMDANGVVHIAKNGPHMHPKVLGGGQSARGAGTLIIGPDGTVKEVTNYSGTFQFLPEETIPNVISAIEGQGVNVAPNAGRGMNFETGTMWP